MGNHFIRRLISLLPTLIGITLITFSLTALIPGDPAEILAQYYTSNKETDPTAAEIATVRTELGLDAPWIVRYVRWLGGAARGDLGTSLRTGNSVLHEIAVRLPTTLQLAIGGMLIGLIIALPIGILAAVKRDSALDQLSRAFALLGAAVPHFWLGAMLIIIFAVRLGWLPAMGRDSWKHFILPSITLGLGTSAVLMRLIRASLLDVLAQDYIRTARAKGTIERAIVLRHALKNSLLPVVTILGLQFGHLLGGAVIIETIFAWQGLGMFIVDSILARDFPAIQGFALLMSLIFVITNFAVDIIYRWLDPRIQYSLP